METENYESEHRFTSLIRVALSSAKDAEQWLGDFQATSKTTWRVDKTYPDPQTKLVFKVVLKLFIFINIIYMYNDMQNHSFLKYIFIQNLWWFSGKMLAYRS